MPPKKEPIARKPKSAKAAKPKSSRPAKTAKPAKTPKTTAKAKSKTSQNVTVKVSNNTRAAPGAPGAASSSSSGSGGMMMPYMPQTMPVPIGYNSGVPTAPAPAPDSRIDNLIDQVNNLARDLEINRNQAANLMQSGAFNPTGIAEDPAPAPVPEVPMQEASVADSAPGQEQPEMSALVPLPAPIPAVPGPEERMPSPPRPAPRDPVQDPPSSRPSARIEDRVLSLTDRRRAERNRVLGMHRNPTRPSAVDEPSDDRRQAITQRRAAPARAAPSQQSVGRAIPRARPSSVEEPPSPAPRRAAISGAASQQSVGRAIPRAQPSSVEEPASPAPPRQAVSGSGIRQRLAAAGVVSRAVASGRRRPAALAIPQTPQNSLVAVQTPARQIVVPDNLPRLRPLVVPRGVVPSPGSWRDLGVVAPTMARRAPARQAMYINPAGEVVPIPGQQLPVAAPTRARAQRLDGNTGALVPFNQQIARERQVVPGPDGLAIVRGRTAAQIRRQLAGRDGLTG
jgi:hypothetical protein